MTALAAPRPAPLVSETLPDSPILDEAASGAFARSVIAIAFVGVAIFVAWAALTPVREMVVGEGVVLPEGFVRRVEHLEGGIVGRILVTEGQAVRAGDPLIVLAAAGLEADLRRLQARHEGLMQEIERQLAFASGDGRPAGGGASGSAIARSQQAAGDVAEAHRAARLRVLRSEVELRAAELSALGGKRGALQAELAIIAERFRQYDAAHKGSGAVSGVTRDNAALQKLQLEREIATLEADIRAADLRVRMAMENEDEFLAAARKEALLRVADLESARAEVSEELTRVEETLARGVLAAPVDGRVQSLGVGNAGQVLQPGALVAEIVPADADLFVEVMLPGEKIGEISVGMPASVKALAFDYVRFGDVAGHVESISPTSVADAEGRLRYRLRLKLAAAHVGAAAADRRLAPGMTVTAEMQGGSKTVLEYLLRPLQVIRDRALSEV